MAMPASALARRLMAPDPRMQFGVELLDPARDAKFARQVYQLGVKPVDSIDRGAVRMTGADEHIACLAGPGELVKASAQSREMIDTTAPALLFKYVIGAIDEADAQALYAKRWKTVPEQVVFRRRCIHLVIMIEQVGAESAIGGAASGIEIDTQRFDMRVRVLERFRERADATTVIEHPVDLVPIDILVGQRD